MLYTVGILFMLAAAQAKSFGEERAAKRQVNLGPYPYYGIYDWEVRLSQGSAGRVEVSYLGTWYSLCDSTFSVSDAAVVCRQLGYQFSRKDSLIPFDYTLALTGLHLQFGRLNCYGSESRIAECSPSWCDTRSTGAAAVTCSPNRFEGPIQPSPGSPAYGGTMLEKFDIQSVRLVDGPHTWEGLVQVQVSGEWKYVCTNLWDDMDAKVACRMMSSHQGLAVPSSLYNYRLDFFQIPNMWMDTFQCQGTENALDQCPSMGYDRFSSNCVDRNMIAAAKCDAGTLAPAARTEVKLEGGSSSQYDGVVKCFHGNQWYPVCADSFGSAEAQVVCNQLFGYRGMAGTPVTPIGRLSNQAHMGGYYEIQCQGTETSLTDCFSNYISNEPGQGVCLYGDATVVCHSPRS